MRSHRKLAQLVYAAGSALSHVKTPRMTYKWLPDAPFEEAFPKAGRVWLPCRTSIRLIRLSVRLDPKCWDHWALDHSQCTTGSSCGVCGGHVHPPSFFEDDEELVDA